MLTDESREEPRTSLDVQKVSEHVRVFAPGTVTYIVMFLLRKMIVNSDILGKLSPFLKVVQFVTMSISVFQTARLALNIKAACPDVQSHSECGLILFKAHFKQFKQHKETTTTITSSLSGGVMYVNV